MSTVLMTKTDLANRVRCHPRTIDNWIAKNEGPVAIRIGRLIRFSEHDFAAWLDRRRDDSGPSPPVAPLPADADRRSASKLSDSLRHMGVA